MSEFFAYRFVLGAALALGSAVCSTVSFSQPFTTPLGYSQTAYVGGAVNEDPGQVVRSLGDIDGDGLADFAIGAPMARFGERGPVGKTYVVYGERSPRPIDLTTLAPELGGDGSSGFEVINPIAHGGQPGGRLRSWLAPLGDVDNDGFDDFAVADPLQILVAPFDSAVYLLFGGPRVISPLGGRVDLLQIPNAVIGNRLVRIARSGTFGSIAGLGDFNADGFDDFAISRFIQGNCTVEVYFGPIARAPQATPPLLLTQDDSIGCLGGGLLGNSDLNGDDVPDLHVCTRESLALNGRSCYVLFGGAVAQLGPVFPMRELRAASGGDGSLGFVILGGPNYFLGAPDHGVAIDIDLNGDGAKDLVYGSPSVDIDPDPSSREQGRVSVLFGRTGYPAEIDLASLLPENGGNGREGFVIDAPPVAQFGLGNVVARAGDVNADGVDDLAIGVNLGHSFEGISNRVFIVFGRAQDAASFPARTVLDRAAINGGFATELVGDSMPSGFGWSMDAIRDLDGDGRDELLVGAPLARINSLLRGMAVLYSSAAPAPVGVAAASALSLLIAAFVFLVSGSVALKLAGSRR